MATDWSLEAYKLAEQLVMSAKENDWTELVFGDEIFGELERLPSQIGELDQLTDLSCDECDVSDLSSLSGLKNLTYLSLMRTPVVDLGPLSELRKLNHLILESTDVFDLSPLAGLSNLELLWLDDTKVTDLRPLAGLSKLMSLGLSGCPVEDLRPLLNLRQFSIPSKYGSDRISFFNCGAAKLDARIAEISRINDNVERARALFDYLDDWIPFKENQDASLYPKNSKLAPLRAQITDGRLRRVIGRGHPETDATRRAEAGWGALKKFRDVFWNSCNVHNYGQLVAALDGFDEAMGSEFDPDRLILIGVMGQGVIALADDASFQDELPTGAPALLSAFGVQIDTFLNRFPDWVSYLNEADLDSVIVARTHQEEPAFSDIEAAFVESKETDDDVASDYALQVRAGTRFDSNRIVSNGLVASTRETMRTLSEVAVEEISSGRIVREEVDRLESVHDTELAKVKWYAGGFAIVFLRRRDASLRRLAKKFPAQLGWLERVLDYIRTEEPS